MSFSQDSFLKMIFRLPQVGYLSSLEGSQLEQWIQPTPTIQIFAHPSCNFQLSNPNKWAETIPNPPPTAQSLKYNRKV